MASAKAKEETSERASEPSRAEPKHTLERLGRLLLQSLWLSRVGCAALHCTALLCSAPSAANQRRLASGGKQRRCASQPAPLCHSRRTECRFNTREASALVDDCAARQPLVAAPSHAKRAVCCKAEAGGERVLLRPTDGAAQLALRRPSQLGIAVGRSASRRVAMSSQLHKQQQQRQRQRHCQDSRWLLRAASCELRAPKPGNR